MTGNIVIGGLLGQGFVIGGFLPPGVVAPAIYIVPQLCTVINTNAQLEIDPTQTTVIVP